MKKILAIFVVLVMVLCSVTAYAAPSIGTIETEVTEVEAAVDTAGLTAEQTEEVETIVKALEDEEDDSAYISVEPITSENIDALSDRLTQSLTDGLLKAANKDNLTAAENQAIEETVTAIVTVISAVNGLNEETETTETTESTPMTVAEALDILNAATETTEDGEVVLKFDVVVSDENGNKVTVQMTAEELGIEDYSFVSQFASLQLNLDDGSGDEIEVLYDIDGTEIGVEATLHPDILEGMENAEDIEDYILIMIMPTTGETTIYKPEADDVIMPPDASIEPNAPRAPGVQFNFRSLGVYAWGQRPAENPAGGPSEGPAGRP